MLSGKSIMSKPITQAIEAKSGLAEKIRRRLVRYYRKWFKSRNHIFMHRGPFAVFAGPACDFFSYDKFDDIPKPVLDVFERNDGKKSLEIDRQEMGQAAVMWLAFFDSKPAGILFTRRGRDFKKWFVDLAEQDIVLFRMHTYPEFRGRGIAPALMSYAMSQSLGEGGRAYIDCSVFNSSSRRSIEKAGFSLVATMKPISRKQALG